MATTVNAGARLDRLPISPFHYRVFWLVGAGMFFDGYDLYVAGGVLASAIQTKFSTVPQNLQFLSLTFVGMTIGALITGFVGDADRPPLYLSDQSAGLRPGVAGRRIRAEHGSADHLPLRPGARTRRRDRRRLFDADRIRAAEVARAMAVVHGLHRGCRFSGHRHSRLSDHSEFRLASDVRHRRRRLADRLVSAQELAGIAALAGIERPRRRSRSADAVDRKGSRRAGLAAAGRIARRCRS